MRSAEMYPYDRRARVEALRGVDKLRAVPDRELAGHMLRLLDVIEGRLAPQRNLRQLVLPQPTRWSRCLEVAS